MGCSKHCLPASTCGSPPIKRPSKKNKSKEIADIWIEELRLWRLVFAGMFDCKPLAFLWGKFPEFYNEDNTIMFDDLRRNFVYNKQNGLVIRPFKHAHRTRDTDRLATPPLAGHSNPCVRGGIGNWTL